MKEIEFTISHEAESFTMKPQDFLNHCNQSMIEILKKIGVNGRLPKRVEEIELMMLDEIDLLLESYFTFKFLIRRYGLDFEDKTEVIEKFIADLLRLHQR